jgi:transcription termination factor Rho
VGPPADMGDVDGFFDAVLAKNAAQNGITELTFGSGVVEIGQGGYAFLRSAEANYRATPQDIYLTPLYVKRYGLRPGDAVLGVIKRRENETMSAMVKVYAINGIDPRERHGLRVFESLTPYYPTQRIWLETNTPGQKSNTTMRVMDLVTPIGRGQRGLIVAPPRTGKTIMLQDIANSILSNVENHDVTLIVVLIDERPEEVTDMKNLVNAEIVSSTFDEQPEHHAALAEMVYERAKRLVENGRHVVILLDSITRLARAYNALAPKSGRILSGGLDSNALYKPKRFFGAARNIRGGGSLTILGTALIDTGSRMDDLIFEEFKGTGNMELHLDRTLADRRIFPAINILKSGTRKEDLIVQEDAMEVMWYLRKGLANKAADPVAPMETLLRMLKERDSNALFLRDLQIRMKSSASQG